jgi:RluA family pseudouridine synthase
VDQIRMSQPKSYTLSCTVDPYRGGWKLREFLAHRFRYHPAAIWDQRIAAGAVRVNGVCAGPSTLVGSGDRIEYVLVHAEPAVDFRCEIPHDDDDCLAVSKSGNLPVHAGGRYIANTLIAHLRASYGNGLCLAHRLDRETSGIVLLAKHKGAAIHFEREFHAGRAEKKYLAVMRGTFSSEFVVEAPIGRIPKEELAPRWGIVPAPIGKPARTLFRALATGEAQAPALKDAAHSAAIGRIPVTLAQVLPESGRTNQIRIHAAHAGHPILGDKVYGVPRELAQSFFREGETPQLLAAAGAFRHLLHASSLSIAHPKQGKIELFAPPPPDLMISPS